MRKHINLIISTISLFVTVTLLIISMFAWYVTNDSASANGIIGTAQGVKGSFDIYRFDYSNDEQTEGDWTLITNSFAVQDAWPGDILYFKIVGTDLDEGQKLDVVFKDVVSILNTEAVTAGIEEDKYCVYKNGYKEYVSNTVNFNVDYNSVTKTLYTLTQDENEDYVVNLKDILIQDVFKLYLNPTFKTVGTITDFPDSKGTNPQALESNIFSGRITAQEAQNGKSIYFALSFDATGSNTLDNYYQYQGISIQNISISLGQ